MVAFQQGSVLVMNDHPSSVRAEGLRAIAALSAERLPDIPDTPTMREAGFPFGMSIWHGLFAPAATPAPVIARLESAGERAARAPAVRRGHGRIQILLAHLNARDFGEAVAPDGETTKRVIDENGLRRAE